MNKESENENNRNTQKEYCEEKIKINSNYNPINEKEQQEPPIQSNITNLQNSACKYFKSEVRAERANFFL